MQQLKESTPTQDEADLPLIELDDMEEMDLADDEISEIDKKISNTRIKPKVVRKNIEHYLEERALKRRIDDLFDDFPLD